jgi:hypothetical protein
MTDEEQTVVANDEADRVILSTPEQKELREDSDIEFEDTPGVPGQIQYPEASTFGQYAETDDESVEETDE